MYAFAQASCKWRRNLMVSQLENKGVIPACLPAVFLEGFWRESSAFFPNHHTTRNLGRECNSLPERKREFLGDLPCHLLAFHQQIIPRSNQTDDERQHKRQTVAVIPQYSCHHRGGENREAAYQIIGAHCPCADIAARHIDDR